MFGTFSIRRTVKRRVLMGDVNLWLITVSSKHEYALSVVHTSSTAQQSSALIIIKIIIFISRHFQHFYFSVRSSKSSVNKIFSVPPSLITINFQFCRVSRDSCRILCPAGVDTTVVIVNRGYDQHAGLGTKHGGGQGGVRGHQFSLQTPGDREGMVSF